MLEAHWRVRPSRQEQAGEDETAADGTHREGWLEVRFEDGSVDTFDCIWLATGGTLDLHLIPILDSLAAQQPIHITDGLPLLQPDLSWGEYCPFYVMGAFAQMQLGPDALNMAGARSGSVIIARSLLSMPNMPNGCDIKAGS